MGAITGGLGGMLGLNGGVNGTGVSANMQTVDRNQLARADQGSNAALQQQQQFLQALQAQNGLGNQSSVFNQLQNVANGTGPNPAQAQLANATGANVANQAALMASQRGASGNAGLMARQAAQQGANIQQQAAGQGAALQANQSLNALNNMGGIANQQAANQMNSTNAYVNNAQQQQSNLLNAAGAANNNNQQSLNTAMQGQQNFVGNLMGGVGSAFGLFAEGGTVDMPGAVPDISEGPKSRWGKFKAGFNESANAKPQTPQTPMGNAANRMGTAVGQGIKSLFAPAAPPVLAAPPSSMVQPMADPMQPAMPMMAAEGGKVPVLLSPGEKVLSPDQAKAAKQGKVNPMAAGKTVPGKPKVSGAKDSYANDTHATSLEPGSVVLPRSVTESSNPEWAAHKFVRQLMAEGGLVKPQLHSKKSKKKC